MPKSVHVNDCARHLVWAHQAYERMVKSGKDGGLALNEEIQKSPMDERGKQAASVWVDFLQGFDPGWYGNEDDA